MAIRIIGLGGIGSHLVSPLCRYVDALLQSTKKDKEAMILIDGDSYEAKNADRQEFQDIGNKAEVAAQRMKKMFPSLVIEAKPHFVTDDNIFLFIEERDTVFLGVDNHATRKLVSGQCQKLKEVILISGGNELTDGNVQIYIRKKGKNLTPPLTHFHPEIADPQDHNPAELSCEALAQAGTPQLIFTNLAVAVHMLSAFWMVNEFLAGRAELKYAEQYFDLTTGMARSFVRKEEKKSAKTKKGDA